MGHRRQADGKRTGRERHRTRKQQNHKRQHDTQRPSRQKQRKRRRRKRERCGDAADRVMPRATTRPVPHVHTPHTRTPRHKMNPDAPPPPGGCTHAAAPFPTRGCQHCARPHVLGPAQITKTTTPPPPCAPVRHDKPPTPPPPCAPVRRCIPLPSLAGGLRNCQRQTALGIDAVEQTSGERQAKGPTEKGAGGATVAAGAAAPGAGSATGKTSDVAQSRAHAPPLGYHGAGGPRVRSLGPAIP